MVMERRVWVVCGGARHLLLVLLYSKVLQAIDYLGGTSGKGSGLTLLPLALPRGILTISNLEYLAQMFDADTQLP